MVSAIGILGWAHWGGLALIVIGYVMSLAQGVIHPVMVWGARLQLLIGLAMVAVMEMGGGALPASYHMFVGIKLVVALAVVAFCEIARSKAKKGSNRPVLMHLAAVLALVNALYGYFG
ncbi:hypothetical protein [Mobilicoccus massiliensis]|uniref:hypothetical protein n=1 Tax=Mobilicoccus massiliensis TaxID=1522310 RepID=UPI0005904949|nr:hypothetical protein [Mobilicoccus massiliensis]